MKVFKKMKGIILAGGNATRLHPLTLSISKHILPVYDKPMIYYPLSILMLAGIREILIISTPRDLPCYKNLFNDGSQLGLHIEYKEQPNPNGLAESFIIGEEFIGQDSVSLILGDNIFYGYNLAEQVSQFTNLNDGAAVFCCHVKNPQDFGVVEFDDKFNIISIEEKPKNPKSNYVIPGLYFYDNNVIQIAKNIKPSARGEIEITAVNNEYLKNNKLYAKIFGRGTAWFDAGNPSSLLDASGFIKTVQTKQGLYIACIEEIAYNKKYITKEQLYDIAQKFKNTEYGKYLLTL